MNYLFFNSPKRVEAYSAFGASSYKDLSFHLGDVKEANLDDFLVTNSLVKSIADKHSKTVHQILLRWALQRNTCPISKTTSSSRMTENRDVQDFELDITDMIALKSLNRNKKYNDPAMYTEDLFGTFSCIHLE